MRVEVRLYATLAEHVASARAGDPLLVKLQEETALSDLLQRLGIPRDDVHLTIINGRPVHDLTRELADGDRIGLFPPVGGG